MNDTHLEAIPLHENGLESLLSPECRKKNSVWLGLFFAGFFFFIVNTCELFTSVKAIKRV